MASSRPEYEFLNKGLLQGHGNWVTSIVAGNSRKDEEESKLLISGSRDRSIIVWRLNPDAKEGDELFGQPQKQLLGHDHFVSDLAISRENQFALSASWDKTLRLWDLKKGEVSNKFNGHTKEVLSCCFNPDNRVVLSGGCEKNIKLWNVKGVCKYTIEENNHNDWVSRVRYSPSGKNVYFATTGWDGRLKIWSQNFQIQYSFKAHQEAINALSIAPVGAYLCTGGKDQVVKGWDIRSFKEPVFEFKTKGQINDLKFHPTNQWLAASTDKGISIWDLQEETQKSFKNLQHQTTLSNQTGKNSEHHFEKCTSLEWNSSGSRLFGGFSDGAIRVWDVSINDVMD